MFAANITPPPPLSHLKFLEGLHGDCGNTWEMAVAGVVETGRDGGFPVQIHLPQEETLIQVVEDETHVLYDQVRH